MNMSSDSKPVWLNSLSHQKLLILLPYKLLKKKKKKIENKNCKIFCVQRCNTKGKKL